MASHSSTLKRCGLLMVCLEAKRNLFSFCLKIILLLSISTMAMMYGGSELNFIIKNSAHKTEHFSIADNWMMTESEGYPSDGRTRQKWTLKHLFLHHLFSLFGKWMKQGKKKDLWFWLLRDDEKKNGKMRSNVGRWRNESKDRNQNENCNIITADVPLQF